MPKIKKYIIGNVYGRLTVLEEKQPANNYMRRFLCKCICGNYVITQMSSLSSGRTISCGCYKLEENRNRLTKNGRSINKKHTREYAAWSMMIQRCTNVNHDRYKNYGGRGIVVCERWLQSFDLFLLDMGKAPSNNYSIDRYPNINGNYEPTNCRWATKHQQYRGKTTNRWVEAGGVKMIIQDFCRMVNRPLSSIHYHLKKGKTIDEIYAFYINKQANGNI